MRKSGCKINSLFRKSLSCLWIQTGIIPSFWKTTVLFRMPYQRPERSVFCRSCDCTGPANQSHWWTDCNPLIFGSHFFGAYFICLFINSPKPALAPISPFSLRPTGSSCLIHLSPEEERVERHTSSSKERRKPWELPFSRGSVLQDRTGWLTLHCQQPAYLGNIVHDGDFEFPVHECTIRVGDFII